MMECDGDRGLWSQDTIQVSNSSIARARAKKFKEGLNRLNSKKFELWSCPRDPLKELEMKAQIVLI